MSCRQPRPIPYTVILVARTNDPSGRPGPDALVKQCSECKHDVWVAPQTVADTGLRCPLVCKQCFKRELDEEFNQWFSKMLGKNL